MGASGRVAGNVLTAAATLLSAAGSATVFAGESKIGAVLAFLGGASAAVYGAFHLGDREVDQIKKRADFLELAELFQSLQIRIHGLDAQAQEAAYASLVARVAQVRGRSRPNKSE